tara:strand:- start:363 stop:1118 length:756 start_codon:yes stop_codon:yes gene_type:complete
MNMMLHCGAKDTPWDALVDVPTPEPTRSHRPVPHHVLFNMVKEVMREAGLEVTEEQHGTTKGGARYFGMMQLHSGLLDWAPVVGLRNSHDKSLCAGLVFGLSVFVCDNLAFYGDLFRLDRKHTSKIMDDLKERIKAVIRRTDQHNKRMELTVGHYKRKGMSNRRAHHMIVKCLDGGAILPRSVPHILEEWRKPRHDEFKPRNAWSLFNAITETMKGAGEIGTHINRTSRLHNVFDKELKTRKVVQEVSFSA